MNLKKQINDLKDKLDLKISFMKNIENEIKNYENECKKIQLLKEKFDANNDLKYKKNIETKEHIDRIKNEIENERKTKEQNEFALENLNKEISNLRSKKDEAEQKINTITKAYEELKEAVSEENKRELKEEDDFKSLKERELSISSKLEEMKNSALKLGI